MSEKHPPYDGSNLPPAWGQVNVPALRAQVNTALGRIARLRPVQHRLWFTRAGTDITAHCWCGKTRLLPTRNINVFCEQFNEFVEEHCLCEQGESA